MTQKNPPGYPLPPGELGDDEIVCQLVYLPDRPEYWQALLAAIHYLSTWRAWERDAEKRGKDAASNWREAFELTMGCWRMTCLDELTTSVKDILELMQTRKDCCDENITYLPVEPITTDIVPDVGDPPDFYGETAVVDWDDWKEHVCYNAHLYVDFLAHAGNELWVASRSSSIFVGLIAALLALLAFSGIGLPIAFGLAATVVSGIVLAGTLLTFEDSEADIEASRNEIVCAILQGGDLAQAVEDALSSGLDWDLFYQFIPYGSAHAIIFEGGEGTEYLPAETRDDCVDCEYEQQGDDDLYIHHLIDHEWSYNDVTKEWTFGARPSLGCWRVHFEIWEDDTRTTRKLVRINVTSCDGINTCGGAKHSIGIVSPGTIWEFDHPRLPATSDAPIDAFAQIHNEDFEIKFKLYV